MGDKKGKAKKEESAGISPAERQELEQLKKDIIDRKAQLKAEGMSGGQQNKDAQVVQWESSFHFPGHIISFSQSQFTGSKPLDIFGQPVSTGAQVSAEVCSPVLASHVPGHIISFSQSQ